MAFNPQQFVAEVSLGLIPSETFPSVAQDALEAGFDGPGILRVAVLERPSVWEISDALPKMLTDLGLVIPASEEAAIMLATLRVQRILKTGEDPILSISYFERLYYAGGYPWQLQTLAYMDEFVEADLPTAMQEAMENLLDPELAATRHFEMRRAWEENQRLAKLEWPFVVNSPSGRRVFLERYREQFDYLKPLLWILVIAAVLFGWSSNSWKAGFVYLLTAPALFVVSSIVAVWRSMRRERQQILWRMGHKP